MKRFALLFLLVGCADGPLAGTTEWRVQLGDSNLAICSGTMTLNAMDPTQDQQLLKFDGTWECDGYAGRAVGDLRENGMMFLDMETLPGSFHGVRATYSAKRREIIGAILITDTYPFAAYMK